MDARANRDDSMLPIRSAITRPASCRRWAANELGRLLTAWSFVALVALTSAGCASLESATGQDVGSPDSVHLFTRQFDDIPVPYGFRIQENRNESLIYDAHGMRIGQLVYRAARESVPEVVGFYRDQMPKYHGWSPRPDAGSAAGGTQVRFAKNETSCNVRVYSKDIYTYIEVKVDKIHES